VVIFTFQETGTACGMIQFSFSRKIYAYCMWTQSIYMALLNWNITHELTPGNESQKASHDSHYQNVLSVSEWVGSINLQC